MYSIICMVGIVGIVLIGTWYRINEGWPREEGTSRRLQEEKTIYLFVLFGRREPTTINTTTTTVLKDIRFKSG